MQICTAIQAYRDEILFQAFGDTSNPLSNLPFWSNGNGGRNFAFWFNPCVCDWDQWIFASCES